VNENIDYRHEYEKLRRKYRIMARAFARTVGVEKYRAALNEVRAEENAESRRTIERQTQHERGFYGPAPAGREE